MAFLLSPEARELRPLLLAELVEGFDLFARDRLRRAHSQLPALLAPRLPLLGPLPLPGLPAPPLPVPGLGLVPVQAFVDAAAPPLTRPEEVYLRSMSELGASALGAPSPGGFLPAPPGSCSWCCSLAACRAGARSYCSTHLPVCTAQYSRMPPASMFSGRRGRERCCQHVWGVCWGGGDNWGLRLHALTSLWWSAGRRGLRGPEHGRAAGRAAQPQRASARGPGRAVGVRLQQGQRTGRAHRLAPCCADTALMHALPFPHACRELVLAE